MSRLTISLPDEDAQLLVREARRAGVPVSALVRRAVRALLRPTDDTDASPPFAALGRSGKRNTARDAEAILAREWKHAGRG